MSVSWLKRGARFSEQGYFADGLTEDFITELSRYKGVHVSARHTSFHYKGKSPKIKELQQELGVGYVLANGLRAFAGKFRLMGAKQTRGSMRLYGQHLTQRRH